MTYVKTFSGLKYNITFYGTVADMLFIRFVGYDIQDVVLICANPEEMKLLRFYDDNVFDGEESGYMRLTDVEVMKNNQIQVTLKTPKQNVAVGFSNIQTSQDVE